ncbi:MAG: glycosidase, partial [bacterium]
QFRGTPGLLMWLLGNENNYVLTWTSFEIEALPEGERDAARARYLYSLFGEIIDAVKALDPDRPVAIANGDLQYIDLIAEECKGLDILGSNVYRGISARDFFQVVKYKLGVPAMFTEFGADAFNAKEMREDQLTQAKYLLGQWEEIYEQSSGKGRAGNAIGGFIFQWSDGWWKFGQDSRLDIHDTNASWPNAGYPDYVEGGNNMRGLYYVYPRAAYYALRRAFQLDPYAPGTTLDVIRSHFDTIQPMSAALQARSDRADLLAESLQRVHVSGLRLEFETYNTGGSHISTPPAETPQATLPAFLGFDHQQSFYTDFEVRPAENVTGNLSLNILGNVAVNRIDEIFYENRGRRRTIEIDGEPVDLPGRERVRVYRARAEWDDHWFRLEGFYRTGHTHWGYEGDFFGLYRDAFYGENLDIYNGDAPVGVEISAKRWMDGFKLAFGPQLWWGANPSVYLKYSRRFGRFDATGIYEDEFAKQRNTTTSTVIPLPPTRRATLYLKTHWGPIGIELGGIWAGSTKVDETFQIARERPGGYDIYIDQIRNSDTFGGKAKLTWEHKRWHWYAQAARAGIVADGGPTATVTYTGWQLKDSGMSNQTNFITGLAADIGNFQLGPNFLWQKPIIGPIPGFAGPPAVPRNVVEDPFAVRENRETVGGELLLTYDPTPATWFWAWDNDVREDARLAWAVGYVYRYLPTTMDAAIGILEDGVTLFPFPGAPPAKNLWEVNARVVSKLAYNSRVVGHLYFGPAEPNGWTYDAENPNPVLTRFIDRFGVDARLILGPVAFASFVKVNDWGPYDYHRDFNLTFPLQLMGDVSYSLGKPEWFGLPNTCIGVRGTWRSLDRDSNRYCPGRVDGECDPELPGPHGTEWELRTYLHVSL